MYIFAMLWIYEYIWLAYKRAFLVSDKLNLLYAHTVRAIPAASLYLNLLSSVG